MNLGDLESSLTGIGKEKGKEFAENYLNEQKEKHGENSLAGAGIGFGETMLDKFLGGGETGHPVTSADAMGNIGEETHNEGMSGSADSADDNSNDDAAENDSDDNSNGDADEETQSNAGSEDNSKDEPKMNEDVSEDDSQTDDDVAEDDSTDDNADADNADNDAENDESEDDSDDEKNSN